MEAHEMQSKESQISVEEKSPTNGAIANAYPGHRTDGTKDTQTRVRRLFNFTQIFFFALTFMSSWETMAL